jgi:hypothetical protein
MKGMYLKDKEYEEKRIIDCLLRLETAVVIRGLVVRY